MVSKKAPSTGFRFYHKIEILNVFHKVFEVHAVRLVARVSVQTVKKICLRANRIATTKHSSKYRSLPTLTGRVSL